MTTTAIGTYTPQAVVLVTETMGQQTIPQLTQVAELVVYAPPPTRNVRTTQADLLVTMTTGVQNVPQTSQFAVMVVYGTGAPDQSRSRAWTYTMDGHTFYVLDLGPEGTYLYDAVTQQWCHFLTEGYSGRWAMVNGCMWGNRVVACDLATDHVFELDPTQTMDEGWRDIYHVVTGGISARSRAAISCASVRVSASFGILNDVTGASMTLTYSDDWGETWSDPWTVSLTEGDYSGEIAWRSLGSFAAPGRIFQLSDTGGLIRIDATDVFLNGFDNDPQTTAAKGEDQ